MSNRSTFWSWWQRTDDQTKQEVEQISEEQSEKLPVIDTDTQEAPDHGLDTVPGSIDEAVQTDERFEWQDVPEQDDHEQEQ